MGRLDKLKRQAINQANIRVLNETLLTTQQEEAWVWLKNNIRPWDLPLEKIFKDTSDTFFQDLLTIEDFTSFNKKLTDNIDTANINERKRNSASKYFQSIFNELAGRK